MNSAAESVVCFGLVAPAAEAHAFELLGDAAELAERLQGRVSVCTMRNDAEFHRELIARGADAITVLESQTPGPNTRLAGAELWWKTERPRVAFVGAEGDDRALAARLAVRCGAKLVSPALAVTVRGPMIEITGLNAEGRRARQIALAAGESAIVTLRPGVGQPRAAQQNRRGEIRRLGVEPQAEAMIVTERIAADPATTDIVHLPRLVAGGRGVGGREGFELLRTVAERLHAGVAASRMAVDLGWIERERQVGETGKTVRPELYLASGISGASHHLQGMSDSRHIIALNNDPQAPLFQFAHLGLVADWRETLQRVLELTEPNPKREDA